MDPNRWIKKKKDQEKAGLRIGDWMKGGAARTSPTGGTHQREENGFYQTQKSRSNRSGGV